MHVLFTLFDCSASGPHSLASLSLVVVAFGINNVSVVKSFVKVVMSLKIGMNLSLSLSYAYLDFRFVTLHRNKNFPGIPVIYVDFEYRQLVIGLGFCARHLTCVQSHRSLCSA